MDREEIIDFIRNSENVTVPSLQKRFSLSYYQAKEIIDELIGDDSLVFASGITYNVCGNKPHIVEREFNTNKHWSLKEYMEQRRNAAAAAEEDEDDEDVYEDDADIYEEEHDGCGDDTDFEEKAYDELIEAFLQDGADESGESILDDEGEEERAHSVSERIGNLSNLFKIKKIFSDCVNECFASNCTEYVLRNELKLGENAYFKLQFCGGVLQISDDGLTVATDCVGALRAAEIINDYKNIAWQSGEIVATVTDNGEALKTLLDLYAAVERIKNGG